MYTIDNIYEKKEKEYSYLITTKYIVIITGQVAKSLYDLLEDDLASLVCRNDFFGFKKLGKRYVITLFGVKPDKHPDLIGVLNNENDSIIIINEFPVDFVFSMIPIKSMVCSQHFYDDYARKIEDINSDPIKFFLKEHNGEYTEN